MVNTDEIISVETLYEYLFMTLRKKRFTHRRSGKSMCILKSICILNTKMILKKQKFNIVIFIEVCHIKLKK